MPDGKRFEPDIEFLRYGNFFRLNEGTPDHRDVAACRGTLEARRLAVQEPQAVGVGNSRVV